MKSLIRLLALTLLIATSQAAAGQVLAPPDLVAWWQGEGNANDSVGSNHAALQNNAGFTSGVVGQAFHFDGVDDFIALVNGPALNFATTDFTIELWMNLDNASRLQDLVGRLCCGVYPAARGYGLEVDAGILRFALGGGPTNSNDLFVPATLSSGQWHHLAAVRSGNTNRIYLDGQSLGEQTAGDAVDIDPDGNVVFGRQVVINPCCPWDGRHLAGSLDEISFYSRSLEEAEILSIAAAGPAGKTLAVSVTIDIKPGSFPNSINLGSNGTVPVAILSSSSFDAATLDPSTVVLAGAAVNLRGRGTPMASVEDIDGNGLGDLVVHVSTEALQLAETDIDAVLTGKTFSGVPVRGTDSVRIVP